MTPLFTQVEAKSRGKTAWGGPMTFLDRLRSTTIVACLAFVAATLAFASVSEATELASPLPSESPAVDTGEDRRQTAELSSPLPVLPDPPLPRDPEDLRRLAVDEMVKALESYGQANGTYLVDGSGFRGRGSGWAFYEKAGGNYPASIVNALVDAGHLPVDGGRDPLWEGPLSITGDMLVYRCMDRVAVFTREGVSAPSSDDSVWWAENGCTRYPIDRLNATYFSLSDPLESLGTARP